MPYTKPVTFIDGTSLNAVGINLNDQTLRKYINGEIVQADLANDAFDTPEIQLGEYQPITNEYTFATGIDTGNNTGIDPEDRSYFTSNIKKGRQTDNNLYIWTSSYHSAGSYKFSYYINAKVEEGYSSARNFKAEVFYK
jgi:hypothetical protein